MPTFHYECDESGPWCRIDIDATLSYYVAFYPDHVVSRVWGIYGE